MQRSHHSCDQGHQRKVCGGHAWAGPYRIEGCQVRGCGDSWVSREGQLWASAHARVHRRGGPGRTGKRQFGIQLQHKVQKQWGRGSGWAWGAREVLRPLRLLGERVRMQLTHKVGPQLSRAGRLLT